MWRPSNCSRRHIASWMWLRHWGAVPALADTDQFQRPLPQSRAVSRSASVCPRLHVLSRFRRSHRIAPRRPCRRSLVLEWQHDGDVGALSRPNQHWRLSAIGAGRAQKCTQFPLTAPCVGHYAGGTNGRQFIARVRTWARLRDLAVHFVASEGSGSHGTLYMGNRKTTVKDRKKEIGKGLLAKMLADLEIDRENFEAAGHRHCP